MDEKSKQQSLSAAALIGTELDGKYRLVSVLGVGAMGTVFKAEQRAIGRTVAVKILHPHLVEDDEFLKRFRHEAKIASKLRHPNLVMIYDYGVVDRLPYLAMELIDGESLTQIFERSHRLTFQAIAPIAEQVCAGLEEAHRQGIVHRDLKPDNILVSWDGSGKPLVRILDFGIAKLREQDANTSVMATQHGMFLGTPRYASPEQALSREVDGRSDIYSLGIILYEGVTGGTPFAGASSMELLLQRVNSTPPPPRNLNPEITPAVNDLIRQCLKTDPAHRFQSAAELAEAIRYAAGALPSGGSKTPIFVFLGLVLLLAIYTFTRDDGTSGGGKKDQKASPTVTAVPTSAPTVVPTVSPTVNPTIAPTKSEPLPTQNIFGQPTAPLPGPSSAFTVRPTVIPTQQGNWNPWTNYNNNNQDGIPTFAPTYQPSFQPSYEPHAQPTFRKNPSAASNPAFDRGFDLYQQQRYGEALPDLEAAYQQDPSSIEVLLALGNTYMRLKNFPKATVYLQQAVRLDPNSAQAHYDLACLYALANYTDLSVEELSTAASISSDILTRAKGEPDLQILYDLKRFQDLVNSTNKRRAGSGGQSVSRQVDRFLGNIGRGVRGIFGR